MLEIRALGPLDIRGSPESLSDILGRPKDAALLSYLVLAHTGLTERLDSLAGLFWPELGRGAARDALDGSLTFLRQGLPDGVMATMGGGQVGLVPKLVECDVHQFEDALAARRWERALGLYRGELLEGLEVPDAPAFHDWLDGERRRLRGLAERARGAMD